MRFVKVALLLLTLIAAGHFINQSFRSAEAAALRGSLQDRDPIKPLQHVVASKTAKFSLVAKDDDSYKRALESHDLAGALKMIGRDGAFKGTVSKLFEERDGDIVVLDFDQNFRTALTAVLRNADFPKFPDMKTLEGKEVLVAGKFVDYHGAAQIELTDPKQIMLVK